MSRTCLPIFLLLSVVLPLAAAAPVSQKEKDKREGAGSQVKKDEPSRGTVGPRRSRGGRGRARGRGSAGTALRVPPIYRVRVTVIDPQRRPVDDARVWSTVGGEPKKVAGGWQFDIPGASVPGDGKVTFYASKENASLSGDKALQLGKEPNPTVIIQMGRSGGGILGIAEVSPQWGAVTGETPMRINGRGFTPGVVVKVGELEIIPRSVDQDGNSILLTIPKGNYPPQKVDVTVVTEGGESYIRRGAYEFVRLSVTKIEPEQGSVRGGDRVKLYGHIGSVTSYEDITFGGEPIAPRGGEINGDGTMLVVVTPPHPAGKVDVVVKPMYGDAITLKQAFTYIGEDAEPKRPPKSNAVSLVLKVEELLEAEKFNEARRAATEAIQLDPQYAKAYHKRGICYFHQGDYDLAIGDHTAAIRLDPQYAEAYLSRGINYGSKDNADQAIRDFTEAITINPQYAYAYYLRGVYYRWKRNYDQAIRDLTEAVRLDPYQAEAHFARGLAYYLNKNYEQAVKAYTEAIRLQPQFGEAYFERAYAYEKLGDKAQAKADRQQAKVTANFFKETYSFAAWRTLTPKGGTLYISSEGLKFVDKRVTNDILSISCSEIITLKVKWPPLTFKKIAATEGVEIKTSQRKDAYLIKTYDDEQVFKLIQRTCKVGF